MPQGCSDMCQNLLVNLQGIGYTEKNDAYMAMNAKQRRWSGKTGRNGRGKR